MMREAETVANKLGITFRVGIDKRIAGAEKVGAHKTSMLQDVEAGKPIEIEALVGAVVELGRLTETPTPHIDAVYALVEPARASNSPTPSGKLSLASAEVTQYCQQRSTRYSRHERRNDSRVSESRRRRRTGAQLAGRHSRSPIARCARSSRTSPRRSRRRASAPAIASASCSTTGRRWRRRFWRSARPPPRRRSIRRIAPTSSSSTSPTCARSCSSSPRARTRRRSASRRSSAFRSRGSCAHPERGAGTFTLEFDGVAAAQPRPVRAATPDDIALVLHTSGTTSRPKIVPLAHKNIVRVGRATSARRSRSRRTIAASSIMPLFHIHGLIAALSRRSPPAARCAARRDSTRSSSSRWVDEVKPTWYTRRADDASGDSAARAGQRRRSCRATGCGSFARRRRRCRRR